MFSDEGFSFFMTVALVLAMVYLFVEGLLNVAHENSMEFEQLKQGCEQVEVKE